MHSNRSVLGSETLANVSRRDFLGWFRQAMAVCLLAASSGRRQLLPAAEPDLDPAAREAIGKGLAFLASRQNEDGSFGNGGYSRNVAICGLCGMAFLANGHVPRRGAYGQHVERCVEFILRHTEENGYILAAEGSGRGPMYGHGFASLFLAEVYGMSRNKDVRDALARAVRLVVDTQNAEGGWRDEPRRADADISVTVCQVMALRAAHNAGIFVPQETIECAVAYVKQCQNPDGGFMYQAGQPSESLFPRSAAAVVALV